MNLIKKAIGLGILGGAFALTGCEDGKYLEGKVVKESGMVANVVPSDGAVFGNESVKFGNSSYVLTINTAEGDYVIDIYNGTRKTLAGLNEAINVGSRVRFRTNNHMNGFSVFGADRIGTISADDVDFLGK